MTRRGACAIMAALLAGCGDAPADGAAEPVPVDSVLVGVLAEVGLAEARADMAPPERRGAARDSLRRAALAAHGWTARRLDAAQTDLAADPAAARATFDAVERALTAERFGAVATEEP